MKGYVPIFSLLLFFNSLTLVAQEERPDIITTKDAYSDKFELNANHILRRNHRSLVNRYSEYMEEHDTLEFRERLVTLLESLRKTDLAAFRRAGEPQKGDYDSRPWKDDRAFYKLAKEFEIWANKPIRILIGGPIRVKDSEHYYHAWVYLNADEEMEQPSGAVRFGFDMRDERMSSVKLRPDDGNRSFFLPKPDPDLADDPIRVLPAAR